MNNNYYEVNESAFIDELVAYHKFDGYIKERTYIEYESDYMHFSYNHRNMKFKFDWKKKRMEYCRPKISYIPSERNIVSFIPDWKSQVSAYDCVLDFMKDWDVARKYIHKTSAILNLGLQYQFDEYTHEDKILLASGNPIALTNSSSGVQSIIPLYVCVDYITRGVYISEIESAKKRTEIEREKHSNLLINLYRQSKQIYPEIDDKYRELPIIVQIDNEDFIFRNSEAATAFEDYVKRYSFTNCSDIYLEEPENNLFPPTQCQLIDMLVSLTKRRKHTVSLFVTTHSPYVLTHLMQEKVPGFRMFFTHQTDDEQECIVQQATEEEIQEIYDNGLDMFFNYEAFVK